MKLWTWFYETALPWFFSLFGDLAASMMGWLRPWLVPFVKVWAAAIAVFEACTWAIEKTAETFNQMDFSGFVSPDSTLLRYGLFIDRFVPLQEAIALAIMIFQFWLVVTLFRWVKSFIPFWSN